MADRCGQSRLPCPCLEVAWVTGGVSSWIVLVIHVTRRRCGRGGVSPESQVSRRTAPGIIVPDPYLPRVEARSQNQVSSSPGQSVGTHVTLSGVMTPRVPKSGCARSAHFQRAGLLGVTTPSEVQDHRQGARDPRQWLVPATPRPCSVMTRSSASTEEGRQVCRVDGRGW